MVEKGVFGPELIKKQRYWPKGVLEEDVLRHMQNKEVGDVDAVQCSIIWKSYHIMLTMTAYGTLEHLEGSDTQRRYKRAGG